MVVTSKTQRRHSRNCEILQLNPHLVPEPIALDPDAALLPSPLRRCCGKCPNNLSGTLHGTQFGGSQHFSQGGLGAVSTSRHRTSAGAISCADI